jgi:hypothetical protein
LAGEFLGYEPLVRGRPYESVAAEFNTGLFGDVTVRMVVENALGFTVHDVRAVRAASVAPQMSGSSELATASPTLFSPVSASMRWMPTRSGAT